MTEQGGQPECDRCGGSGVRQIPYVGIRADGSVGALDRTHEARCLCTFPTLWKHRDIVRGIFKDLAEQGKRS